MNILYCGDQDTAPLYIFGSLRQLGYDVTYIEPGHTVPKLSRFDVYILSDYPARDISQTIANSLIEQVASGKRFIMLGGWESFNGFGSNYYNHPISNKLIPVAMQPNDDRVNAFQGLIVRYQSSGDARTEPDWNSPPVICGYNAAVSKPSAEVLVSMVDIIAGKRSIKAGALRPFVIKSHYLRGTTIACLTDLAPHWSGGLTDWGKAVQLSNGIQVGDSYLKFIQFLLEA